MLLFASEVQARMDTAEADAVKHNRPPGPAVQHALERALGIRRHVPARPSERGQRFDYDLSGGQLRVIPLGAA